MQKCQRCFTQWTKVRLCTCVTMFVITQVGGEEDGFGKDTVPESYHTNNTVGKAHQVRTLIADFRRKNRIKNTNENNIIKEGSIATGNMRMKI